MSRASPLRLRSPSARLPIRGAALLWLAPLAWAYAQEPPARREMTIPLEADRRITGRVLAENLAGAFDLDLVAPHSLDRVSMRMDGWRGAATCLALRRALGDGCEVELGADHLRVSWDVTAAAERRAQMRERLSTLLTGLVGEEPAAGWGIRVPEGVLPEDRRPVLLLHGVDAGQETIGPLAAALEDAGYTVWPFLYPNDDSIAHSAGLLATELRRLHERLGPFRLLIVAHSMGGLVARAYIEDDALYGGDVDLLVQIATPNAGADLARLRVVHEIQQHGLLGGLASDPENGVPRRWLASIRDGLGQAGDDLTPGSNFLRELNARPRREGVRYAIVAGCRGILTPEQVTSLTQAAAEAAALRRGTACGELLALVAQELPRMPELVHGAGDGVVSLDSARLPGAHAWIPIRATHCALLRPGRDGTIPCLPATLKELGAPAEVRE